MLETLHLILTQFTDEAITIASLTTLLLLAILVVYWIYNRKKFHRLKHEIPASIVKNYLDSIIQNSTALKSSLFRGGGLDIGEGIPSVRPLSELPSSGSIALQGASMEELNQKNAEILALKNTLSEKNTVIEDLKSQISELENVAPVGDGAEEISRLKQEVKTLKEQLKKAQESSGGGVDPAALKDLEDQLAAVTKERDEFKERLMEYEIIEEDLANLKRLQQENEQLKKSIAALKGGKAIPPSDDPPTVLPPAEENSAPETESESESEPEEVLAVEDEALDVVSPMEEEVEEVLETDGESPDMSELEAEMSAAIGEEEKPVEEKEEVASEIPESEDNQKSADELLNEFEKMLG